MAAQTNYEYRIPKGVPGGKFDLSYDNVVSRHNEAADGELQFGMAVQIGNSAGVSVKKVETGATKEKIEGILVAVANVEQDMSGKAVVKNGASLSVMKKGKIWGRVSGSCEPEYGKEARVVVDGDDAGMFTDKAEAYTAYVKAASETASAKEVVEDTASPTATQIKISEVTPVATGYEPAVGDYVLSKQLHGATVSIGAVFGAQADDGIAVIEL